MILKTDAFKEVCNVIANATDSSELSTVTETLELKTEGTALYLNVTNKEYYASVKFELGEEVDFHATVKAKTFLDLIKRTTVPEIELEIKKPTEGNSYVAIKGNGNYKVPLIFDGDKLMDLPVITIENETLNFNIGSGILVDIANFNIKQLDVGTAAKPVQKMVYMDEQGAITFTSGACVNAFTLEQPVKVLMKSKLVKLFKLFKDYENVAFTLGYDPISETIIQTKVSFKTANITLTAITECDDALLKSVPATAIRGRATAAYGNSVVLDKQAFFEALDRIQLFNSASGTIKPYSKFEFGKSVVKIYSYDKESVEELSYMNGGTVAADYEMTLDTKDLLAVLSNYTEQAITLSFGNHQAAVIKHGSIANVLPECRAV